MKKNNNQKEKERFIRIRKRERKKEKNGSKRLKLRTSQPKKAMTNSGRETNEQMKTRTIYTLGQRNTSESETQESTTE